VCLSIVEVASFALGRLSLRLQPHQEVTDTVCVIDELLPYSLPDPDGYPR
jgi:hypothetical protein